ncbi:MAG: geranylgeranylglyceryl/heptaprenylglyceryl phosphate synthase [Bacillota bacterium]
MLGNEPVFRRWRHVIKLDPDRELPEPALEAVLESGTDAVVIGGTQGITLDKVRRLVGRCLGGPAPVALEVTMPEAVVLGPSCFFIPSVLNAADPRWVIGAHAEAAETYGPLLRAPNVVPVGYLVLNPESAAAKVTGAGPLPAVRAAAFARCGEALFRLPVIYIEYSGAYGSPGVVRAVTAAVEGAQVFYGGGIDRPELAAEMAALADTVVVGNVVYTDGAAALRETVAAVRETPAPRRLTSLGWNPEGSVDGG